MGTLIITVIFGLIFAFFATANTQSVTINIADNLLVVPVYLLTIVSVLIGLLISAVISGLNSLSSALTIHSKDNKIKQKEQTVDQLSAKIHDLEIENARLQGENNGEAKQTSFFKRFRLHPTS